jgi:hypothetical protein
MSFTQFLVIGNIQTVFTVIGIILVRMKYEAKQSFIKLLGFYLMASLAGTILSLLSLPLRFSSNYVSIVLSFVELPMIIIVLTNAMGRRPKVLDYVVIISYCAFVLSNAVFIQGVGINSYTFVLKSIIIIPYTLLYFYWLLRELPTTDLHRLPMFWVNTALIIFFSGNLFLFIFTDYLVHVLNNDLSIYWTLHNILAAIETLMIVVALWLDLQNTKLAS